MADWQAIKAEYITTDTSYRKLAQKYGISHVQIGNVGRDEKWVELRRRHLDKTLAKSIEKIGTKQADKMARIDSLTDKLLTKLEKAVDELDLEIIVIKDKTVTSTGERTEESKIARAGGIVDRAGLKQLTAALKDIKEVKMLKTELDRQEQEARIEKLRREAEPEKGRETPKLVVEGMPEEFKV